MQLDSDKTYRLIHPEHNWAMFVQLAEECLVITKDGEKPGYRLGVSLHPDMQVPFSGGMYLSQDSLNDWQPKEVDSVGIFGNLKKLWP